MLIYIGHSSSFNYKEELYLPLKTSELWDKYTFILPHDEKEEPTDSKLTITHCDLVIAEVSYPSTGLGIELGWANVASREILCLYKDTAKISSSLNIVCSNFLNYSNSEHMIEQLSNWLIENNFAPSKGSKI